MKKNAENQKPFTTFVREYMAGLRKRGVALPKLNDRFDADHLNGMIRSVKRKAKQWAL